MYLDPEQLADDIAARVCRDWLQLELHTSAARQQAIRSMVLDVLRGSTFGFHRMQIHGGIDYMIPESKDPADDSRNPER